MCGPTRRCRRRAQSAATSSALCRRDWWRTALERSVNTPCSARCHHFEPVCRLTPAARAAALIVQPVRMRCAKSARPRGVRRALRWAIEGSFFDCGFTPTAEDRGPSARQQPDWELDLAEGGTCAEHGLTTAGSGPYGVCHL